MSTTLWPKTDIKSSGFHPVAMSPTARMGIVDHMNSHYRRIHAVKAVVDTSPPKSYLMRHSPSPSRHSSRSTSRSSLNTDHSQYMQVNREEVLQTTNKINYYLEALRREQQRLVTQVASPNPHFRRPVSISGTSAASLRSTLQRRNDLMDKHSEYFTPAEPFAPRLLRTKAKSRIQEYRWYNPPRRKETKLENEDSTLVLEEKGRKCRRDLHDPADGCYEQWFEEQHRHSRDRVSRHDAGSSHLSRKSSSHESLCSDSTHLSQDRGPYITAQRDAHLKKRGCSNTSNGHLFSEVQNKDDDEELKYLEFVVDITNDILLRGIYTNKVLKQVFNSHLEKKKHQLSREKMEQAVKQLKTDLGIIDDDVVNSQTFGYGPATSSSQESKHLIRGGGKAVVPNGHWVNETLATSKYRQQKTVNSPSTMPPGGDKAHNSEREISQVGNGIGAPGMLRVSNALSVENGSTFVDKEHLRSAVAGEKSAGDGTYDKPNEAHDTASEAEDIPDFEENSRRDSEGGGSVGAASPASSVLLPTDSSSVNSNQRDLHETSEKLRSLQLQQSLSDQFYAENVEDHF